MRASSGHQVNDGDDLLHERQRKLLTHPQHRFKPAGLDEKRLRPSPSDRETALLLRSRLDNVSFLMPHAPAFPVILPPLRLSWEGIRATKDSHHPVIGQAGEMTCATALIDSKQEELVAGGNHFIWSAEACWQLKKINKEFLYPIYILLGEGRIIRWAIYCYLSSDKVIFVILGFCFFFFCRM